MKTTGKVKKVLKFALIAFLVCGTISTISGIIGGHRNASMPVADAQERTADTYSEPDPAPDLGSYQFPKAEMPQEIPTGAWFLQRMGSESMLVLESSTDRIIIELAGVNVSPDAIWFIQNLIGDQWLTLSFEHETSINDINARAYVYLSDGTCLQEVLLYRGMATVNSADRSLIEHFTSLEEAARQAKVGIWAN